MEAILIRLTRISRIQTTSRLYLRIGYAAPLPASFRQQEGGALMVLNQSKKMKSVFSYLVLGLLQGADS